MEQYLDVAGFELRTCQGQARQATDVVRGRSIRSSMKFDPSTLLLNYENILTGFHDRTPSSVGNSGAFCGCGMHFYILAR